MKVDITRFVVFILGGFLLGSIFLVKTVLDYTSDSSLFITFGLLSAMLYFFTAILIFLMGRVVEKNEREQAEIADASLSQPTTG